MKSWVCHLKNKYPGSRVIASENAIDVFANEDHVLALRKNGNGDWHDESANHGCTDRFCLAPIPRDARVHKVGPMMSGKDKKGEEVFVQGISRDDEADERESKRAEFMRDGKIASMHELQKEGFAFCEKGRCVVRPSKKTDALPQGNQAE